MVFIIGFIGGKALVSSGVFFALKNKKNIFISKACLYQSIILYLGILKPIKLKIMIVTKEQLEALITSYVKSGHNLDQCDGFIDGVEKAMELISKLSKQ